ncbi:hypothetical protein ACFQL0_05180 [Haloplanus litoreus]|uniref:hypothetical protein n=1 Tax=Haloplanus litoreus TaxID=767515 RepID=UPI00361DA579
MADVDEDGLAARRTLHGDLAGFVRLVGEDRIRLELLVLNGHGVAPGVGAGTNDVRGDGRRTDDHDHDDDEQGGESGFRR